MKLTIKPSRNNGYPLHGILIRGHRISSWIQAIQEMGFSLPAISIYPIPGTRANTLWGCLLIDEPGQKEEGSAGEMRTAPDIGRNNYCQCIHGKLFIPENSRLYPKIDRRELDKLLKDKLHLYHPEIGWLELPEVVCWKDLLAFYPPVARTITTPEKGIFLPARVHNFYIQAIPPEEMLEEMEGKALAGEKKFNGQPLSGWEKTKLWFLRLLFSSKSGSGPGKPDSKLAAWLNKLQSSLEDLEERNNMEVGKLLDLFKRNPHEALKYAIPIDGDGISRGSGKAAYTFSSRWSDFSLFGRRGSGGGGGSVSLGEDYATRLTRQYQETAQDFMRNTEYRQAAFVYLRLLKNYPMAADSLERGGLFAEAASVHLTYTKDKAKAAECYEKGKMFLQAIDLYKELDNDEKVGDLYLAINRRQEAHYHFEKVVDQFTINHQYIKAAIVSRNKMGEPAQAQALLLEGWQRNSDAVNCLTNYFSHIRDDRELEREIKRIYAGDTGELKMVKYLEVMKHQFNSREELAETIRDIAYEIVAEKLTNNPAIVSELLPFNKKDKNLTKDILKYKQSRK